MGLVFSVECGYSQVGCPPKGCARFVLHPVSRQSHEEVDDSVHPTSILTNAHLPLDGRHDQVDGRCARWHGTARHGTSEVQKFRKQSCWRRWPSRADRAASYLRAATGRGSKETVLGSSSATAFMSPHRDGDGEHLSTLAAGYGVVGQESSEGRSRAGASKIPTQAGVVTQHMSPQGPYRGGCGLVSSTEVCRWPDKRGAT